MKKLFLLPLLLFSPLFALPIGNPMDPALYNCGLFCGDSFDECCSDPCDLCFSWCDAWSVRFGFYGDYVFNRHMELANTGHADIKEFEIYTNGASITLNICDRLDIFGTLGTSDIFMLGNPNVFGAGPGEEVRIWTDTDFSWSIGARLTAWACRCWYFGLEGQYFYTKPDITLLTGIEQTLSPDDASIKFHEWQVGVGAAYLMEVACSGISVIPYAGFKWAGARADFNDAAPGGGTFILEKQQNSKYWGWSLGMTVLFCETLSVTAEGRWGDEKALHINGQIRF